MSASAIEFQDVLKSFGLAFSGVHGGWHGSTRDLRSAGTP
jgi:hypothetical protein